MIVSKEDGKLTVSMTVAQIDPDDQQMTERLEEQPIEENNEDEDAGNWL